MLVDWFFYSLFIPHTGWSISPIHSHINGLYAFQNERFCSHSQWSELTSKTFLCRGWGYSSCTLLFFAPGSCDLMSFLTINTQAIQNITRMSPSHLRNDPGLKVLLEWHIQGIITFVPAWNDTMIEPFFKECTRRGNRRQWLPTSLLQQPSSTWLEEVFCIESVNQVISRKLHFPGLVLRLQMIPM